MLLKKETGGCEVAGPGGPYVWANDGDEVDVDYEFAVQLLAVRGGGYSTADDAGEPVAEPAVPAGPVQAVPVPSGLITPPAVPATGSPAALLDTAPAKTDDGKK